jgi:ADP-ribose pyrophosphatase
LSASESPVRRVIFRGRKIDLALQSVELSDGNRTEREVVVHPGAVALVPMVDDDHVCLLRNFRHAIGRELIEVPAGTLDKGEDPAVTAARELREETGYTAERIVPLGCWYVSPGIMTEVMHLYRCEGLTPGEMELEPDETLAPFVVPWTEAVAMVRDRRIIDAKSMLAILICDGLRAT